MDDIPIDATHPLVRHLWPLGDSAKPEDCVRALVVAFNESSAESLELPLEPEDAHRVAQWANDQEFNVPTNAAGHGVALLAGNRPIAFPRVHPELSHKIGWLGQAPCITCIPDDDARPLGMNFPIQAEPFSAQAVTAERLRKLKEAITADLRQRSAPHFEEPTFSSGGFCVTVVAVVPSSVRMKDIDNMVKGLLDTLSGIVYKDDKQVQHLSAHRVKHDGDLAFYGVNVRPVRDPRVDVLDHQLRLGFVSGRPIRV